MLFIDRRTQHILSACWKSGAGGINSNANEGRDSLQEKSLLNLLRLETWLPCVQLGIWQIQKNPNPVSCLAVLLNAFGVQFPGCEMLCSSASIVIFRSLPMLPAFTSDMRLSMKNFFSGELPKTFNIRYLLLQMKAVRSWSHMEVALSQQCMWKSCPKHSMRHNPYLRTLWPYRKFEFSISFNALNFSTGSHNRIGYLLAFFPL